ncbi:hypothetical protein AI27_06380 [Sphingomonas sp. BHC-A]|uniref:Uncharacterized protein n=1 Tax=Sphingobium indicum (strain DSM 16412 / CCM 7286 / MTCC 6364 / B90A) TaxID=861109 RepID=A0A1L5BMB4_SPHIB|nr:hypothetical protein [Sphingobium indicum]APL94090.1 hypothetical protein SIDU_05990 [Sphingobium indicum B90A]KEZ00306.1 hypothetical protein AI27_06380 [Sphingomonas sp. BHC-A]
MAELKTYRARERGYVDDRMIEEGETFTTAAPKGKWMALLDKDGNEIEDPEPEPKADPLQAQIDELKSDLSTAQARAEGAEKARDDARAEADQLKSDLSTAQATITDLQSKIAAFDHDGDGQPGGSAKTAAKK